MVNIGDIPDCPTSARATPRKLAHRRAATGFTLVEMIVSMTLIALLSLAAIPLIRIPFQGWMDATRRANLTTELDVIHAKLRDDLARAMPGSVRITVTGTRVLMEYLEVSAVGRYRTTAVAAAPLCPAACSGAADANDVLETGCAETCFVNLAPWDNNTAPTIAATDWVVVNPLGATSPYATGGAAIRTPVTAAYANGRVDITATTFATLSPLKRFYITTGAVTYECDTATRVLTRYWGYGINAAQPTTFTGVANAALSRRVRACSMIYQAAGLSNKGGLVNVLFQLGTALGESDSTEVADLQGTFSVSEGP